MPRYNPASLEGLAGDTPESSFEIARHQPKHMTDTHSNDVEQSPDLAWRNSVIAKIDVAFILVGLVVVILSGLQIQRMSTAGSIEYDIAERSVPALQASKEMSHAVAEMRSALVNYTLDDKAAAHDYQRELERLRSWQSELGSTGHDEDTLRAIDRLIDHFDELAQSQILSVYDPNVGSRNKSLFGYLWTSHSAPLHDAIDTLEISTNRLAVDGLIGNESLERWLTFQSEIETFEAAVATLDRTMDELEDGEPRSTDSFQTVRSEGLLALSRLEDFLDRPVVAIDQEVHDDLSDRFLRYVRFADTLPIASINATRAEAQRAALDGAGPLTVQIEELLAAVSEQERTSITQRSDDLQALARSVTRDSVTLIVVTLAVLITGRALLKRFLLEPLRHLAASIDRLRNGSSDLEFGEATDRRDELALANGNLSELQLALVSQQIQQEGEMDSVIASHDEQLKAVNAELSSKDAELRRAVLMIRSVNGELDQFVHVASHDLRAPMQKIGVFCDLLEMSLESRISDEQRTWMESIRSNSTRLLDLVDALRVLTTVRQSGAGLRQCDLGSVLYKVLGDRADEIDEGQRSLTIDELPTICGYPDLLERMFEHLIDNAIKFSGVGQSVAVRLLESNGSRVTIEVTNRCSAVAFRHKGERRLRSESVDRLLLPFVRGDTELDGIGVGLTICLKIARLHGGYIRIREGSPHEFNVEVTLQADLDAATPDTDRPRSLNGGAVSGVQNIGLLEAMPTSAMLTTEVGK